MRNGLCLGIAKFCRAKKTEKVLSFLETVTNIKVQILDANRILLNFLGGNQDLNLTLTLTLTAGYHGNSKLIDVQVLLKYFDPAT